MTVYKVERGLERVRWNERGAVIQSLFFPIRTFQTKNNQTIKELHISDGDAMGMGHEIGHILDCRYLDLEHYATCGQYLVSVEIRAWRVAKSILKPELWNEREAINCIWSYANVRGIYIKWWKFKIIPLNKGLKIRLTNEEK